MDGVFEAAEEAFSNHRKEIVKLETTIKNLRAVNADLREKRIECDHEKCPDWENNGCTRNSNKITFKRYFFHKYPVCIHGVKYW